MFRRLLLLSFVVALVVGFTLPVFAQEEDSEFIPFPRDKEYKLEADCKCAWFVTVKWEGDRNGPPKNGPPTVDEPPTVGEPPPDPAVTAEVSREDEERFFCFRHAFKRIELPSDLEEIKVEARLLSNPWKLTGFCAFDKHDIHSLRRFQGECKVDNRCKFDFELERSGNSFPRKKG
jgi:hypothetical protein